MDDIRSMVIGGCEDLGNEFTRIKGDLDDRVDEFEKEIVDLTKTIAEHLNVLEARLDKLEKDANDPKVVDTDKLWWQVQDSDSRIKDFQAAVRENLEMIDTRFKTFKSRIENLEKQLANMPSLFKDFNTVVGPFNRMILNRLELRIDALEQTSGMDIDKCIAGDAP